MRVLGKLPSGAQHRAGLDQLPAGLSGPERGVYATLGLGLTILAGTRPRLAHLAPAPAAPQVLRQDSHTQQGDKHLTQHGDASQVESVISTLRWKGQVGVHKGKSVGML